MFLTDEHFFLLISARDSNQNIRLLFSPLDMDTATEAQHYTFSPLNTKIFWGKSHGESPMLKKNWTHHRDNHCPNQMQLPRCFVKQNEASHLFLWEQVAFPRPWLLACSKIFTVCIQINCVCEVEITLLSEVNLHMSGMCSLLQTWWVLCVVVAFCDCVYDLSRIVPVFNILKVSSVMSQWKKDERGSATIDLLLAQDMLVTLCEHHILKLPFHTSLAGMFTSVRAESGCFKLFFSPPCLLTAMSVNAQAGLLPPSNHELELLNSGTKSRFRRVTPSYYGSAQR